MSILDEKKRVAIVGQSGGPTVAINASLAGVIGEARKAGFSKVYGMVNGISGFLEGRTVDLFDRFPDEKSLDDLAHTPSMYLGSCRHKLPEVSDTAFYKDLVDKLDKLGVTDFFYIGGNDSMDTVAKLSAYGEQSTCPIRFIGIPKTIDNDLLGTDHTPGFGSAARVVSECMRNISFDARSYNLQSVTIVEIMGRDAGWLAAASALAGERPGLSVFEIGNAPDLIYLCEIPFDIDSYIEDVKDVLKRKKTVVVAVSEGIHDKDGVFIDEADSEHKTDAFGHTVHSGVGKVLEGITADRLGIKVRSVELSVLQRCLAPLSSPVDLYEARNCGRVAINMAMTGETGIMIGMDRTSNSPYQISYAPQPIEDIPNKVKTVPLEWIDIKHHGVTEEMMDYLRPLVG